MAIYEIPLSAKQQTMTVTLAGTEYRMRFTYADAPEGAWVLDIGDSGGDPLVCGIPLLPSANLLGQYAHLGIGGWLFVVSAGDADAIPTFAALGTTSRLYFQEA